MNNERGSITIPCLLTSFLLLALATGLLCFSTREYEHTRAHIRSRQLRLWAASALVRAAAIDAGQQVLGEHVFYPDNDKVRLILNKTSSSDGLVSKTEVAAKPAKHVGAEQRFKQFHFRLDEEQQALGAEYAMIGKQISGTELLPAETRYIQAQEVSLPQVDFMQELNSAPTAKEIADDGLNASFYYISNAFAFPTGGKTIAGSTVFAVRNNMTIYANTRFTGRVVLISRKGTITIGKNCRFDNALIMAAGGVTVQEGCRVNGCIISPNIVIKGSGTFIPYAAATAPFHGAVIVADAS